MCGHRDAFLRTEYLAVLVGQGDECAQLTAEDSGNRVAIVRFYIIDDGFLSISCTLPFVTVFLKKQFHVEVPAGIADDALGIGHPCLE